MECGVVYDARMRLTIHSTAYGAQCKLRCAVQLMVRGAAYDARCNLRYAMRLMVRGGLEYSNEMFK